MCWHDTNRESKSRTRTRTTHHRATMTQNKSARSKTRRRRTDRTTFNDKQDNDRLSGLSPFFTVGGCNEHAGGSWRHAVEHTVPGGDGRSASMCSYQWLCWAEEGQDRTRDEVSNRRDVPEPSGSRE